METGHSHLLHTAARNHRLGMLGLGTLLALIAIGLEFSALRFDLFRSDVAAYWQDSLNWRAPYHTFHVPGYALLIAALRGITSNTFPPLLYMIFVTSVSLLLSMYVIYRTSRLFVGPDHPVTIIMPFLLAFWPLAGLYAVIYPIADYLVIALFLLGIFLFMRNQPLLGSLAWAGAVITHKAIWPFIAFSFLAWGFWQRRQFSWKWLLYPLIILSPLVVIWIGGASYHHDWKWILSSNLNEIKDNKLWYPFHGILESFALGDTDSLLKGTVTTGYGLLAAFLLWYLFTRKPKYYLFGCAVAISALIMAMSLNEGLTWGFVRFGRLLVLPLGLVIAHRYTQQTLQPRKWLKAAGVATAVLCVISQFVYTYYIGKIYFQ